MYRLLLVDDEKKIREGLSQYFPWENMGFEICAMVENGQQALDYVHKNAVDAVLCDIRMAEMDGIQFAKHIVGEKRQTKIVFLSGYSDFEYVRDALRYGAYDYILKPTSYNELTKVFTALREELDALNGIEQSVDGRNRLIESLLDYLKKDYATATLNEAALCVHMSMSYVSRLFKKEMGKSFSEYLMELKMKQAAHLLKTSDMAVYQIALSVGYDNPKNFTRAFKQFFGMSPKEYKRSDVVK